MKIRPPPTPFKPTKEEVARAGDRTTPDIVAPNLKVFFCGINPGLYSAAVEHNFGRPGNRFWPTLHAAGFTPRIFSPFEEWDLLPLGYGITNLVSRATATAAELSNDEIRRGGTALVARVKKLRPQILAILGVGAYRAAFGKKQVTLGEQSEKIGTTRLWVLPNPSGLNARFQLKELSQLFRELRKAAHEK